jgi:Zn-dependent protease with chaperone function
VAPGPAVVPTTTGPVGTSVAERRRRLRLGTIALVSIAAIVLGSFLLTRGDGTAGAQSPSAGADAVAAMCLHLRDLQTPRVDAFSRVAKELVADADAIEAAGNPQAAVAVRTLRGAVIGYRNALKTQGGDDTAAAAGMEQALSNPDILC